ncbi:MAG: hypothetical protein OXO48_06625 [Caldilineaceae bacterium]|nr:hypothetical protein [Caldilineaceae bacterium]
MIFHLHPERLAASWRRRADTAVEHGQTPALSLGLGAPFRHSCLGLLALGRVAHQHLGPQNPVVIAGGDGWLWLLASLVWRPAARQRATVARPAGDQTRGVDDASRLVLYSGADSALYAASHNIAALDSDPAALPPGLDWTASPTAVPAAEGSESELLAQIFVPENHAPNGSEPDAHDWLQKAGGWAGGLLALGLLAAAFFG